MTTGKLQSRFWVLISIMYAVDAFVSIKIGDDYYAPLQLMMLALILVYITDTTGAENE